MNPGKSNVYYISLFKKKSGNRKGERILGRENWKKEGQDDGQRKRNSEFCFSQHFEEIRILY